MQINLNSSIKLQNMSEKKIGVGVGVFILRDGKVLLGKRHENADLAQSKLKGAGTWTMPGGGVEFGESFEDAAIRETKEETGLDLKNVRVICLNMDKAGNAQFVTIGLQGDVDGEPKVMAPDEITQWQWFPLDKLPSPLYFPSEKVLKNIKEGKFYLGS